MAKKQIKELVIKVTSPGGKEANTELKQLAQSLESALDASNGLTVSLKTGSKFLAQMAVSYSSVTKSINDSVTALKALNTALNGGTAKASKSINAYVDNLQILTMYLMDAAEVAKQFQLAMSAGSGTSAFIDKMDRMIEILEALETTTFDTADSLRRMDVAMEQISVNTGKTAARVKQARDNITDLDVTTNRGNETLEEYAARLRNTGERFDQTGKKAATFNNQLKNLNGTGSQSARSFSSLAFGMNPLVSTYAAIAVNVYALTEAFRILKDAAALDRLEEQTSRFAASMTGINVKGLARDLQELSGGALDAAESLKQAVRGISFGFSPELLKQLTEGARKASVALGRDFTDSMDRVIRGISKGEVELLDELGVVTRLETAFENYAASTGLSADKLTDSQRKLALAQEVNLQLAQKYAAFETSANSLERLGVAATDTTNAFLKMAADSIGPAADELTGWLNSLRPANKATMAAAESLEIYKKALKDGNVLQASVALEEYNNAMVTVRNQTVEGTKEFKELNKSLLEEKENLQSLAKVILLTGSALTAYITVMVAAKIASTALATATVIVATATAGARLSTLLFTAGLLAMSAASKGAAIAMTLLSTPVLLVSSVFVATAATVIALISAFDAFANDTSFADAFDKNMQKLNKGLDNTAEALGITEALMGDTAKSATELERLMSESKASGGLASLSIPASEAKKALLYLQDAKEGFRGIAQAAADLKKTKTGFETIAEELQKLQDFQPAILKSAKDSAALAATLSNLKDIGVISVKIDVDTKGNIVDPRQIEEAIQQAKRASIILKDITAMSEASAKALQQANIRNSGRAEEERLSMSLELSLVNNEILNIQEGIRLGTTKITEEAYRELLARKDILELQVMSYDKAKALEESLYRSNLYYEGQAAALSLSGASQIELLNLEKQRLNVEKERLSAAGASTVDVARQMESLDIQIDTAKTVENRTRLEQQMEHSYAIQSLRLEEKNALESDFIALQIKEISAKQNMEGLTQLEVEKYGMQVELLEEKLRITKQQEAVQRNIYNLETALMAQERRTDAALNNVQRVNGLESELAIKRKIYEQEKLNMTAEQRARAASELAFESKSLNGQNKAAPFADAADTLGYMSGLEGLTELQSTFSSSLGDLSSVYSDFLAQSETGTASFLDYLKNSTEGMGQALQAGLSLANSVFQEISSGKVAAIEREIEAEQRRDGKSAESLAKIKKLQAQQIKEEAKAKKASVGMSTAAAIMQIWAGPMGAFPPAAAAMTAVMAGLGALQLSNVDKAANGQLAALNGSSGGGINISAGSRENNIDVSRNANAGELAYLSGAAGSGTANNFIPGRSGFGASSAGTSIVVGESGPEIITPTVPVTVGPQSQGSGAQITFSPVYQLSAIDAYGMEELMLKHSKSLYESLEKELNAKNQTLGNLQ